MQVIQASPELVQAVHAIIAVAMAHQLLCRRAKLRDARAVTSCLSQSGFGAASIRALNLKAAKTARQIKTGRGKEE